MASTRASTGLAIDGSLQQDDFGLGASTYATSRSPVNLDAVESASLVASDYAVSASGFTGGLVNITTKSGTNEWDGAAFYYFHGNDQVGNHILRVGGEYESFDLYNLFVPSSNGRFVFRDYAAIASRTARVDYVNVPSNEVTDGAAAWGLGKTTIFVQDTGQVRPNLELTAGLRHERFTQDDLPPFSRTAADTYGIRADKSLDGLDLPMPRLSFRWTGLPRTVVTGGIGRFSGGDPNSGAAPDGSIAASSTIGVTLTPTASPSSTSCVATSRTPNRY